MSEMPERIWARLDDDGGYLPDPMGPIVPTGQWSQDIETNACTEYVRADLYEALRKKVIEQDRKLREFSRVSATGDSIPIYLDD